MKLRVLLKMLLIQIIFEWKVSINQKVKAKPSFRYLGALRVNETKGTAENAFTLDHL